MTNEQENVISQMERDIAKQARAPIARLPRVSDLVAIDARDNPDNPKKRYGAAKPSIEFTPPIATTWLAIAMQEGAAKYGPFNWRVKKVEIGTYRSAAQRHWDAYFAGETHDPKTGIHHLAYAMACAAIVLDAEATDSLIDNRPPKSDLGAEALSRLIEQFTKKVE